MKVDIFNTENKYKIIYADPAWLYRDKAVAGGRGAGCHYTVTSLEDIKALPVEKLADDDSVLFMWVTMPFLEEHSKKPAETRDRIVKLMAGGGYLK